MKKETKISIIVEQIKERRSPFKATALRTEGISMSTVYRAIQKFDMRRAYQQKHGNFYCVHFPHTMTRKECRAWLDRQCKSQKSKARLYD